MEDLIFGLQILSWTTGVLALVLVPLWAALSIIAASSGMRDDKEHLIFVTPFGIAKLIGLSYVFAGIPDLLP